MARSISLRRVRAVQILNLADLGYGDISERSRATHTRLIDIHHDVLRAPCDGGRTAAVRLEKLRAQPLNRLERVLHVDCR